MHYPWIYTILPPIHPALHIQNRIPKTLSLHYSPHRYPLLRPDSSIILTQLTSCMSPLGTTISSHMISPNLLGLAFIQDGPLLACYFPLVLHQFKSLLHLWCANQFQLSPYTLHWPFSWKWSIRLIHNISCINYFNFIYHLLCILTVSVMQILSFK